jgi:2-polyprenyl-3-methyl-5-hydroxy-6-metoxy-1,4-benzoquinol methylase
MDQPNLEAHLHSEALVGLKRINALSGSARIFWPFLRETGKRLGFRKLRVLDLACGGGDVLVRLWCKANKEKVSIEFAGCDISPFAVSQAQAFAKSNGANIDFFVCNVIDDPIPQNYDVLMNSLFLHHLDEGQGIAFLSQMAKGTSSTILVQDLVRSIPGYLGLDWSSLSFAISGSPQRWTDFGRGSIFSKGAS